MKCGLALNVKFEMLKRTSVGVAALLLTTLFMLSLVSLHSTSNVNLIPFFFETNGAQVVLGFFLYGIDFTGCATFVASGIRCGN
jgi:hypothetical protein